MKIGITDKTKDIFNDLITYGVGSIIAKGFAFVGIYYLTTIFTPEQYGELELLITIFNLFAIFITLGSDSVQTIYYNENGLLSKTDSTKDYTIVYKLHSFRWISILISSIVPLILFSLIILFSLDITFGYSIANYSSSIYLIVIYAMLTTLHAFYQNHFRLVYEGMKYNYQLILKALFLLILYYILFEFFGKNIENYFLAQILSIIITIAISLPYFKQVFKFKAIDKEFSKNILKLGLPLVPTGLIVWIFNAADRWVISIYLSNYEVGIFALASSYAAVGAIVFEVFRVVWLPYSIDMTNTTEGKRELAKYQSYYNYLSIAIVVILEIACRTFVIYFVESKYIESIQYITPIFLAQVVYNSITTTSVGMMKARRTDIMLYMNIISFVLNIILNILLINILGINGVIIGTIASLTLFNILAMIYSKRKLEILWDMKSNIAFLIFSTLYMLWVVI